MVAGKNPGFVGDAGRIGTQRHIIAARLDDAQGLALLLLQNVAENAALLAYEVFAAGTQFVKHAPGNEHGGGHLGSGMAELLASVRTVVLEEADILDASIVLEIEDALGGQTQEVSDLVVAGVPKMAVVARILHQHFMRADGMHPVVKTVTAATRLALNVVKRCGMHHGTSGPRSSACVWHCCDDLRGRSRIRAKQTSGFRTWRALGGIISRDDPGSSDGILAEFHATGEHRGRTRVNCVFHYCAVSTATEGGRFALL